MIVSSRAQSRGYFIKNSLNKEVSTALDLIFEILILIFEITLKD